MSEGFQFLRSRAVPLPIENVDTDQIIPARFLKATTREGFGENLFRDWRYDRQGQLREDFVLNDPTYSGEILLAGKNFGSGSSREHAAWALKDYGFKVVVSSFFADIFKSNALNNNLLPIVVEQELLSRLFRAVEQAPETTFEVDLGQQTFSCPALDLQASFAITPYKKMCLMEGYDDVAYLTSLHAKIRSYQAHRELPL